MIQYVLRQAKRFVVLVPGIIIAYFSINDIFPFFNRRVPLSVALLITYALGAYLLIPALIRLLRILLPPRHLPLYCVTPDGFASDPLNVGLIGTRRELINAMQDAGWYLADRHSLRNVVNAVLSTALNRTYLNAPVSSLYLFGRKQDIAFELPTKGVGGRHHVRFWATTYEKRRNISIHGIHWHGRKAHIQRDDLLWVGAASLDIGLNLIRHNFQLTHRIDPDTNAERELIVRQLRKIRRVEHTESLRLESPYRLINRTWRGFLHTDGVMTIVRLKRLTTVGTNGTARPSRSRNRSPIEAIPTSHS